MLKSDINILESYANKIIDYWSDASAPFKADGGALQYFSTDADLFEEI
jgi:hypothetical protein